MSGESLTGPYWRDIFVSMREKEIIKFKGTRNGLVIVLDVEEDFPFLLRMLKERLSVSCGFLEGSAVCVDVGPRDLQLEQIESLRKVLALYKLVLRRIIAGPRFEEESLCSSQEVREVGQEFEKLSVGWHGRRKKRRNRRKILPGNDSVTLPVDNADRMQGEVIAEMEMAGEEDAVVNWKVSVVMEETKTEDFDAGDMNSKEKESIPVIRYAGAPKLPRADIVSEEQTILVQRTIRSGQRVYYPGNVVVLGDVNPGGEVVAGGNIIVMGSFRGVAHAGAMGNENAVVAALRLEPSQLRIAGYITRAPEGDFSSPQQPEIARVQDGIVIIEQYQPGNDCFFKGTR